MFEVQHGVGFVVERTELRAVAVELLVVVLCKSLERERKGEKRETRVVLGESKL